jgi:hypothetical protein
MINSTFKRLATLLSSSIACFLAHPAFGQSAPELSLKTTASTSYETNPFLLVGDDTGSAKLQLSIQPEAKFRSATGDINLAAQVTRTEYEENRFTDPFSWGLSAGTEQRLSASIDARMQLRYDNSIPQTASRFNELAPVVDTNQLDDPSFEGRQIRRKSFSASGGVGFRLDQRNRLDFSASTSSLRLSNALQNGNNDSYDFSGSASNQISSTLTLGASLRYSQFTYSAANDKTTVLSPAATATWKISSRTLFNFTGGASLVKSNTAFGRQKSTSLYADMSLCDRTSRKTLCVNFGQYTEPSAFDGVRNTIRAGTTFSVRLDQKTRISGDARYVQTKATSFVQRSKFEYFSVGTTLNREISRPLAVFAAVRYDDAYDQGVVRKANGVFSLGVSYRFGG